MDGSDARIFVSYWQIPLLTLCTLCAGNCSATTRTYDVHDPRSPLNLVREIALPNVRGRIDHMALDLERNHLFVAEYGNGSVDDIDLKSGKVVGRITRLDGPQGVAWLAKQKEIAVAADSGQVTFYREGDRHQVAALQLGDDADDVRVDTRNGNLVVAYGSGGLAVIDPATHRVIRKMIVPAHPEGFELIDRRAFVNVPNAHKIVIGDLDQGRVTASLGTGHLFGNFPMASDGSRIAVGFRIPGALSVMDARSEATIFTTAICGDADDLYFRSGHIIVVCGSGAVELVNEADGHGVIRVATAHGARTGLLDQPGGRLFVAVPAHSGPAAVWVLSFH